MGKICDQASTSTINYMSFKLQDALSIYQSHDLLPSCYLALPLEVSIYLLQLSRPTVDFNLLIFFQSHLHVEHQEPPVLVLVLRLKSTALNAQ